MIKRISFLLAVLLLLATLPLDTTAAADTFAYEKLSNLISKTGKLTNTKADPTFGQKSKLIGDEALQSVGSYSALLEKLFKSGRIDTTVYNDDEAIIIVVDPPKTDEDSYGLPEYSITNAQVQGVDEPEIVKTNGKNIFYLQPQSVNIFSVGKTPKRVSKIEPKGNSTAPRLKDLFLFGNKLVVCASAYDAPFAKSKIEISQVIYYIYDISNAASPKLLRELHVRGYNSEARVQDGKLYFAVRDNRYAITYDKGILADVIPSYTDSMQGNGPILLSPDRIYTSINNEDYYTLTTIGVLDLTTNNAPDMQALFQDMQLSDIYMNENSLYICEPYSAIVRFARKDTTLEYVASCQVDGRVLNNYSMDEYDGVFRVAITEGNMNYVYTFNNSTMKKMGNTSVAKGESIYSVRFMGDTAYVVTFRRVDPLFVIDMKNPSSPKVLGELKVPGFSNYLHPFKEGYLIGIGKETKPKFIQDDHGKYVELDEDPLISGIKLSLFDVRDPRAPKEVSNIVIGNAPGDYDALVSNPRTLMVDAKKNLIALPISYALNDNSDAFSGGIVVQVNEKNGFKIEARMPSASNSYYMNDQCRFCYVGSELYFIDNGVMQVYDYATYKKLATVKF